MKSELCSAVSKAANFLDLFASGITVLSISMDDLI